MIEPDDYDQEVYLLCKKYIKLTDLYYDIKVYNIGENAKPSKIRLYFALRRIRINIRKIENDLFLLVGPSEIDDFYLSYCCSYVDIAENIFKNEIKNAIRNEVRNAILNKKIYKRKL